MPTIHALSANPIPVDRADLRTSAPSGPKPASPLLMTVPDSLDRQDPQRGFVPASAFLLAQAAVRPVSLKADKTKVAAPAKTAAVTGTTRTTKPAKAKPIPTIGAAAKATKVGKGYHVRGQLSPGQVRDLGPNTAAEAAWQRMQADAAVAGIVLTKVYSYRSIAEQRKLWNASDKTGRWVARPGKSEHHTGLAFDINAETHPFGSSTAYKWMKQHAYEYGFVQSMSHEPWHWRYDPEAVRIAVGRFTKKKAK